MDHKITIFCPASRSPGFDSGPQGIPDTPDLRPAIDSGNWSGIILKFNLTLPFSKFIGINLGMKVARKPKQSYPYYP
jgi:hypothetical protein